MPTVRRADGSVELYARSGALVGRLRGPRLSDVELFRAVAKRWSGWRAVVATAIFLAESEGYTHAEGDLDKVDAHWGPSEGLAQIRVPRGSEGSMFDVDRNLDQALVLWRRRGWMPWGAYSSGRYLAKLQRARAAAKAAAVG